MRYLFGRLVAALVLAMFLLAASSRAQCNLIEVWVDPAQGVNIPQQPPTFPPVVVEVQINNPQAPTKTVQFAIDLAFKYLREHYDAGTNPHQQAIIHLMPGLYAPDSMGGNGEHFPIVMRDRVHLRGVGARRCVIRGVPIGYNPSGYHGYDDNLSYIFIPTLKGVVSPDFDHYWSEVLVDFTLSGRFSVDYSLPDPGSPPWACNPQFGETMELIDGVSFQGGDVQVRFGNDPEGPLPLAGRLSNCLFDMRAGYQVKKDESPSTVTVTGPRIGLLMTKPWTDADAIPGLVTGSGYTDQKVHLAGNTFVMAEFVQGSGWSYGAISGSAAVVDAGWPAVGSGGTIGDPDYTQNRLYKGVGHPGLQNNVFRTYTGGQPQDYVGMATVGITAKDALVSGAPNGTSNAYCSDRCGTGSFVPGALPEEQLRSIPVDSTATGSADFGAYFCGLPPGTIVEPLWDGNSLSPYPPPSSPAVALWDGNSGLGTAQYDPAFVGEYLRTVTPPMLASYRDWRLLPGSPLKDKGYWDGVNAFAHGFSYPEDACEALQVALWDGESYGSPRIIDEAPDIGFDEIHLAVIAGSYHNSSLSHNRRGFLNPFVYDDEQAVRFAILPLAADSGQQVLVSRTLKFVGNEKVPSNPPSNGSAWTKPPGSLTTPIVQAGSPVDYDQIFTARGNPLPWMQTFSAVLDNTNKVFWLNPQGALGQQPFDFYLVSLGADDEGSGATSWVNIQPYVYKSGFPVLWGNMQPEFR